MLSLAFSLKSSTNRPEGRISGLALLAALCACVVACSSSDANPNLAQGTSTGNSTSDSTSGDGDIVEESVHFVEDGKLYVAPGGLAELKATVSPARKQPVTFEILSESDLFDGYLNTNTVQFDESGSGSVILKAPSEPSEFEIRVSLASGAEARKKVEVTDLGKGSVSVAISYDGNRDIDEWQASVWPGVSCEDIDSWFMDSDLSAAGEQLLEIADVPAGTLFSVTVRGGQLASSCVAVKSLTPDSQTELELTAIDRPLSAQSGKLTLFFDATPEELQFILKGYLSESLGAESTYAETTDASRLLKQIASALPKTAESDLNSLLDAELSSQVQASLSSPTAISDTIRKLLLDAIASLDGQRLFEADLVLDSTPNELKLRQAAGVPADEAGFTVAPPFELEVGTLDTVSLGGGFEYKPLLWMLRIAEAGAEGTDAIAPELTVAEAASCGSVWEAVWTASEESGLSGCDEDCFLAVCQEQAAALWFELEEIELQAMIVLGVSATAKTDNEARIEELSGTWIGKTEGSSTSLKGTLSGRKE